MHVVLAMRTRSTHSDFGVDDVGNAAENDDEVEHVPRITEIVLRHQQHHQQPKYGISPLSHIVPRVSR